MTSSHAVLVPPTYAVMTPTVSAGGQYKAAQRLYSRENDYADTQVQNAQKMNNLSQKKRCTIFMFVVSSFHCTVNIHLFALQYRLFTTCIIKILYYILQVLLVF